MKAFRKASNHSKGVIALSLVLFFLLAGLSKNIGFVAPAKFRKEFRPSDAPGSQLSQLSAENSFVGYDPIKDGDQDDFEFVLIPNFAHRLFAISTNASCHSDQDLYSESYTIPLYDLYCNWKLHLS